MVASHTQIRQITTYPKDKLLQGISPEPASQLPGVWECFMMVVGNAVPRFSQKVKAVFKVTLFYIKDILQVWLKQLVLIFEGIHRPARHLHLPA